MSGALPVRVEGRAAFPLAQWTVEVLRAEGAVQLRLFAGAFDDGAGGVRRLSMANVFAGPATAGELRALADHLEGLEWR